MLKELSVANQKYAQTLESCNEYKEQNEKLLQEMTT